MSERYIFNKKLYRAQRMRKLLCCWLGISVISFASFKTLSQENQPVLVDTSELDQAAYRSTLNDIDFRSHEDGRALINITFNNDDYQMHISQSQGALNLSLPAVKLGKEQLYKLDVVDFATPVSAIETFQSQDASRVEFAVNGTIGFNHQRNGNKLTLEVFTRAANEQAAEANNYRGKPISLDFQDVPVRQVLQIIAQINGFNLVTTDTVSGNVTISLTGVPWDQALGDDPENKRLGQTP